MDSDAPHSAALPVLVSSFVRPEPQLTNTIPSPSPAPKQATLAHARLRRGCGISLLQSTNGPDAGGTDGFPRVVCDNVVLVAMLTAIDAQTTFVVESEREQVGAATLGPALVDPDAP